MSAKQTLFAPLEGAELEVAIKAIVRARLSPADFLLEERRTQSFALGSTFVHKLINVTRVANAKQRQYSTGRGGGWPFEFERDLQCGFFGSQWPAAPGAAAGVGASR